MTRSKVAPRLRAPDLPHPDMSLPAGYSTRLRDGALLNSVASKPPAALESVSNVSCVRGAIGGQGDPIRLGEYPSGVFDIVILSKPSGDGRHANVLGTFAHRQTTHVSFQFAIGVYACRSLCAPHAGHPDVGHAW